MKARVRHILLVSALALAGVGVVIADCEGCLGALPVGGEYNGLNEGDCVNLPPGSSSYIITPVGGNPLGPIPLNPDEDGCIEITWAGGATVKRTS